MTAFRVLFESCRTGDPQDTAPNLYQSALFEGNQSTRDSLAHCADKLRDLRMSQSHAKLGLVSSYVPLLSPL
jgi:hypothetical protein